MWQKDVGVAEGRFVASFARNVIRNRVINLRAGSEKYEVP
jgi:hypothetical protein